MKKTLKYLFLSLLTSCTSTTQNDSPVETARLVAESFYHKDNETLKDNTTKEGYEGLLSIQNFIGNGKEGAADFKIIQEKTSGDIAWVKFTTNYDKKPETFKLLKENGVWKVTRKGVREKNPF